LADCSATGYIVSEGGVVASGAWGGRPALAVSAVAGIALLTFSAAACGSGGVSGLASAAGAGPSEAASTGSAASAPGSSSPAGSPAGSSSAGSAGVGTSTAAPSSGGTHAVDSQHPDPFSAAVDGYLAGRSGTVLAAVYDVRTGQSWRLGDGPAQDEASVVKLDILETLLSASGGTGLSSDDQGLAEQMIEDSDNDAATSLWYDAGGTAGVAAYNDKVGLTRTTPSDCVVCADFPWPGWGLTTTVPYDQITLLKQLIEPGPTLTSGERQYALSLLENVAPGQAWGVSGGVPAGVTVALKNGWLPLNDDNTDWQINSEGWVSGDGRDYLVSVLTTGNPSEQYGIDTIGELSAMIWTALG
jgi:Beta-lactamase enzyme family